jgi:putative CocE/NonD family hydrolase
VRSHAVRVQMMGINEWREFEAWPPATQTARYYLHQQHLSTEEPAANSTPDRYRYDPGDPTPTIGGAVINNQPGQQDNRLIERRDDVLCYTTLPLERALEIIGIVRLELYVRSSLEHADFFARLCDVTPAGESLNVCEGLLRIASGSGEVQADGSLRITVELWPTAYHFAPGHCLRLQVSNGAHPRWDRQLGTGESFVTATRMLCADQTIYHDRAHPSALILPSVS